MTRHTLSREIAFWLIVKLALLTLIYLMFFRPDLRPSIDTADHLLRTLGDGPQLGDGD